MTTSNIIEFLGFERAVSKTEIEKSSDEQTLVLEKLEAIDIDKVYFCDDENRSYPAVFFKEIKTFSENNLRKIAEIHNQIWNYKKVLFLYVYNATEVRVYNCAEKPFPFTENTDFKGELSKLELEKASLDDEEKLRKLNQVFSAVAIDTGIIWTIEEAYQYRKKINQKRKVDKYLVDSLTNLANELHKKDGLDKTIIHKVILRSLFLLYLEDRGATDKKFYNTIKSGANKYFDFLEDKRSAYNLYQVLQDRFNGNIFTIEPGETDSIQNTHLGKIRDCLTFGYDNTGQKTLFEDWRLFNFKIISVELLSEIYENFIADLDGKAKKDSGTFYTPTSLVELILNENLPIKKHHTNYTFKVLDPACGSGIFLVESFKRIVKRYENKHNVNKLTDFKKLKELLLNNIYGIEIDRLSLNVAAFSLYLALLDNLEPKTLWQNKRLPILIQDPDDNAINDQGKNLFKRDAISNTEDIESIGFDLVVGNPPFGTKNLLPSIKNYCKQYNFAKESALPFLHKAIEFSKDGKVALIFNTKVLTNTRTTYQNFREWLFNKCYVHTIYNFSILRKAPKDSGGQLFNGATVPISIVIYQKEKPENENDSITYIAPKSFLKSNVLEGIVIDKTDVKYLPREECMKPNTKIWKIAMWGGSRDLSIINKISNNYKTLKEVINSDSNAWIVSTGLLKANSENLKNHTYIIPDKKVINTKKLNRYYTDKQALYNCNKKCNPKDLSDFKPPFVLVKEGQSEWMYCSSIIEFKALFLKSALGIKCISNDKSNKIICALINSKFAKYYLSLTSSSWGIERERVQPNEILSLPFIDLPNEKENELIETFDKIIKTFDEDSSVVNYQRIELIEKIDSIIFYHGLNLRPIEVAIIEDTINNSLDLFESKEKSKAYYPIINSDNIVDYGVTLSDNLNNFLVGQDIFANPKIFQIDKKSPLLMVKLSFEEIQEDIVQVKNKVSLELKNIYQKLWKQKASNIYFKKQLNYYDGDDIYIIRPNQHRFWTKTAAMEDASEIIFEILTKSSSWEKIQK